MTVVAAMYGKGVLAAYKGEFDWTNAGIGDIYVSLHTGYTPDLDVEDYWDDVAASEVAATGGYDQYGKALGTPTIGYTAGTNVIKLDGDDVVWTTSTISATVAVIYSKNAGATSTWPLIAYQKSSAAIVSTGGSWTITWNASGICTITVGAEA